MIGTKAKFSAFRESVVWCEPTVRFCYNSSLSSCAEIILSANGTPVTESHIDGCVLRFAFANEKEWYHEVYSASSLY